MKKRSLKNLLKNIAITGTTIAGLITIPKSISPTETHTCEFYGREYVYAEFRNYAGYTEMNTGIKDQNCNGFVYVRGKDYSNRFRNACLQNVWHDNSYDRVFSFWSFRIATEDNELLFPFTKIKEIEFTKEEKFPDTFIELKDGTKIEGDYLNCFGENVMDDLFHKASGVSIGRIRRIKKIEFD